MGGVHRANDAHQFFGFALCVAVELSVGQDRAEGDGRETTHTGRTLRTERPIGVPVEVILWLQWWSLIEGAKRAVNPRVCVLYDSAQVTLFELPYQ